MPRSAVNSSRTVLAGAFLALAALAAYHNSFAAPFFFDDRAQITDNPTIRHLWRLGTVLSPPVKAGVGGRPLLNLSFAINYALGGMSVWGYHALNLLIHIGAGLALLGIVRRTLGRLFLAFAVALIWTLHPLQTEAVTYVAERAESQMGLFYLLTVYCFIRYAEEQAGRRGWALLSIAACFGGICTKEVVVTAPVIVLLYDRTFVSGTFRAAWRRHGRVYSGLAATWLLLAYLLANLKQRGVGLDLGGGNWWAYALTESRAIVRYLCLAVWPHPQIFDYGMGVRQPGWEVLPYVAMVLALLLGTAWALFSVRKAGEKTVPPFLVKTDGRRALGFAGAWFFLILAPTSSVIAVAGQPTAEHRMYLPLAAVIAVVVCGGYVLLGRLRQRGQDAEIDPALRGINFRVLTPLLAIAIVCGCLTARRNEAYRSEKAIWSDTVAKQPDNERAQNGLGLVLAGEGDWSAAIGHYREAIRLNPDYPDAHQNLAAALEVLGRNSEAEVQCREVLRLRPENPESHSNLGVALQLEGRSPAAIAEFDQALRLRPDDAGTENNLGLALVSVSRFSEAAAHFGRAVRLQPDNPEWHLNLGSTLYNGGDIQAAVLQIEEAIRLRPGFADAHYNLAVMLNQMGRSQEAAAEFAQAQQLRQNHAP